MSKETGWVHYYFWQHYKQYILFIRFHGSLQPKRKKGNKHRNPK